MESNKYALRRIVQRIDRDIKSRQHWKVFDQYFDEVHEDFIARLKEKHPDLTPKELRLCAYLKMNISTKEIAPLMNISIRGVEISRYRLRKKLALDKGTNLTEYILTL
jgi:DNA-binding CsgD family transcriptional regulator